MLEIHNGLAREEPVASHEHGVPHEQAGRNRCQITATT